LNQELKEKKVKTKQQEEEEKFEPTVLVEPEVYLKTGAHIGTKFKTGDMKRYIYKARKDGLKVLNIKTLDERIKLAANFINMYPVEKIIVVARKLYSQTPVKKFAETLGFKALTGRFVPGTFTNPKAKEFIEPKLILCSESDSDAQAIKEASAVNAVVISLVSTNNALTNVDLAIPVNNKGRRSLALVYWLLTRELLKLRGGIEKDSEYTKKIDDFEYKLKEGDIEQKQERQQRPMMRRNRYPRKNY